MAEGIRAMIGTLLISTFLVCAVPPPLAMVGGPMHKIPAVKVFELLSRVHWDHPERKFDDDKRTLLVIGKEAAVVEGLRSMGWNAFGINPKGYADVQGSPLDRHFPFAKHVARIAFHSVAFPDNPFELKEMIIDIARTLEVGGYFVGPASDNHLVPTIFQQNNFSRLPFGLFHRGTFYFIYQKQASTHNGGKVARRRIEGAA